MNLISLAEKLSGEQRTATTFDAQRCLHSRDKLSNCVACFDICPTNAIQPGKPPQFDADACQHCFACLPVCPTGAYATEDELPDVLRCLARLDSDTLELVCQHHPAPALGLSDRAAAIQVRGCLAGLGVAAYLHLATQTMEGRSSNHLTNRVIVRTDVCQQCPWQSSVDGRSSQLLSAAIHDQVLEAQHWLRGWEREEFIETVSVLEEGVKRPLHRADSPPLSRRDLFRGQVYEPPPADVTTSLNPFHQRLRTLSALHQLPLPTDHRSMRLPQSSGFARLSVAENCSACGACARACPTGALVLKKDDRRTPQTESRFQLSFSIQACLGCDACAHLCPEQAITVDHELTLGAILQPPAEEEVLVEGRLVTCERCRGRFAAASMQDGLCSVCNFRRQNPFGSRMPPHLAQTSDARKAHSQPTGENT